MTGGTTGRQTQALSGSGKARVPNKSQTMWLKKGRSGGRDGITPRQEAGVSLCGPPSLLHAPGLAGYYEGFSRFRKSRGLSRMEKRTDVLKKKKKKVAAEGLDACPGVL